ncbi:MerR family transcriptional regulator [Mycobacterium sp. GA-1285]|uniref:MerR family transcriptional regulator n=1 Tax=Mycobacterium sp. GA-1285 TaxID=1772282 RepID=UPI000748FE85|nr:MerR family transcriptional regulator [Mycobacterium sp. GA-1285]KUI16467.1 MerR family transcriptional regulator [Mycobacterium sp. GA-1285]
MAEYRLDELAQISGVSARNIRAYRERGLLDPPRRIGRSAFYDDYHLSQLRTINQLHRRGFNSAHIAEFFASLRQGADLADILGIQRAVLGPSSEEDGSEASAAETIGDGPAIGADSDEGRRLVEYGLGEVVDGVVVLTSAAVRRAMARSADPLVSVQALLDIVEATDRAVDALAAQFVEALGAFVAARFGSNYVPTPDSDDELGRAVREYRDLWASVVSGRLDESLHRRMSAAEAE